jgi:hypothetical protein
MKSRERAKLMSSSFPAACYIWLIWRNNRDMNWKMTVAWSIFIVILGTFLQIAGSVVSFTSIAARAVRCTCFCGAKRRVDAARGGFARDQMEGSDGGIRWRGQLEMGWYSADAQTSIMTIVESAKTAGGSFSCKDNSASV